MIKQNYELNFKVVKNSTPKTYDIYWKVGNVGYEAIRWNCIRGQINKEIDHLNETTNFCGLHYVKCYIIKDRICVASDRISVSIDYD